jgi:hypothetical protein
MSDFTFFDFNKLTEDEEKLNRLLHSKDNKLASSPKKQSIQNVLAYSKAISIKDSRKLGFIENVLN